MSANNDITESVKHLDIADIKEKVKQLKENVANERFYITTAIDYTNGLPHMGHAYEKVTSDVIARYHRQVGRQVFFLTGTDEHGQKIATTAEKEGITPIELCNKYAAIFQTLVADLNISNDAFVRTTNASHKSFAQWIFQRAMDAGDIYLGQYEGWYNAREETFVTDTEAQQTDYKDPTSGIPYTKMSESSYFFKMSKYQEKLVHHINTHPEFLQPEFRRQEILKRLEEPLIDLSCSRTTFSHGVPLPVDPKHVMYVWFDALSNYLSALDYANPTSPLRDFWPANVHIIGKDIVWFHCVIWPCILMSADIPLPKRVYAHGFVNAKDGTKMSKSIGNVVDPYAVLKKFGVDSFRYFLIRATRYGHDMPFSDDDFINIHNSELADTLGNLVHRTMNITHKYASGQVPASVSIDKPFDIYKLIVESELAYQDYALQNGCTLILNALKETNKYLTDKAPWHMKENEDRLVVVRTCLEAIYVLAHLLKPLMPSTADTIFEKLGTAPIYLPQLSPAYDNLVVGTPVVVGDILFQKILTDAEVEAQAQKLAAKENPSKKSAAKAKETLTPRTLLAQMDIRVGKITKVWEHPDSDKLFCEEIDVGSIAEGEPSQVVPIASGLRKFYTLEEMQNRKVLVLLNLKPAKLGGFKSCGMVLCASNAEHDVVEFVEPPLEAAIGERIFVADDESDTNQTTSAPNEIDPLSPAQMKKQKIWEKYAKDLVTDSERCATFQGKIIRTSAGPCVAKSLTLANIS